MSYLDKYKKYKYKYIQLKNYLGGNPMELDLMKKDRTCTLINTKKDKYYIHTYTPPENTGSLNDLFKNYCAWSDDTEYIKQQWGELGKNTFENYFDTEKKEKCCNCISFVLYSTDLKSPCNVEKYLRSILFSCKNIYNNFHKEDDYLYLVRFYIDDELDKYLKGNDTNNICKNLYKQISEMDNVEIYIIDCNPKIVYGITRGYRLFSLIDDTVNISVMRDADACILNMECYNLRLFAKGEDYKEVLFYFPSFGADVINRGSQYKKQMWVYIYEFNTNEDIRNFYKFNKKIFYLYYNFFTISAGNFTTKLKLNKIFFNRSTSKIIQYIEEKKKDDNIYIESSKESIYGETLYKIDLSFAFDELLLYELFCPILSIIIEADNYLDGYKQGYKVFQKIISYEYDKIEISLSDLSKNIISENYKKFLIPVFELKIDDDKMKELHNTFKHVSIDMKLEYKKSKYENLPFLILIYILLFDKIIFDINKQKILLKNIFDISYVRTYNMDYNANDFLNIPYMFKQISNDDDLVDVLDKILTNSNDLMDILDKILTNSNDLILK